MEGNKISILTEKGGELCQIRGISIYCIDGGKIAERQGELDKLGRSEILRPW
jgi:hypothetical protein